MAGTYLDFWRIVKPASSKSHYVTDTETSAHLYSNFSWYTKILKGSASRFGKYNQYKNMDSDVFVARALDTIAEEMTPTNIKTNLPFNIVYQNESNEDIPDVITMTVRAALRHWTEVQDFNTILFDIARTIIKFGDCFFRKTSDFKKWKYVEPSDVIGITIDPDGKIQAYHVRVGEKSKSGAFGDVVMVPAAGMVHFSLSSHMTDNGPFGESVLQPTIKAYRHLSLLEDAVIIYRIVRAPERRVFSIDTGNMPPQRAQAYLEAIQRGMRQKRIPNETGGVDAVDSVYNPMCLSLDTRIPLLDGRTLDLSELIKERETGKQHWVYSVNPDTGEVVPGQVSWAGVTRRDAEVVRVTLDNGKTITTTPDHMFPVKGVGFVRADQLNESMSLYSFEKRGELIGKNTRYDQVFDHKSNEWRFTHRLVAEYMRERSKHNELHVASRFADADLTTVHHVNFNHLDNDPSNLVWMNHQDHFAYHSQVKAEWWREMKRDNPERISEMTAMISKTLKDNHSALSVDERAKLSEQATVRINSWMKTYVNSPKHLETRRKQGEIRKKRMAADPEFKSRITSYLTNPQSWSNHKMVIGQRTLQRFVEIVNNGNLNKIEALAAANADERFLNLLAEDNVDETATVNRFSGQLKEKGLRALFKQHGYRNWKHFKAASSTYNHRVVSVELLSERMDTGCITVDGDHEYHDFHTFALEAGVFTKNSMNEDFFFSKSGDGRGSTVDTLPGGENLGEISDLNYFQNKFLQGLRIPSSYMRGGQDASGQLTDGKVGIAYIEELRFANYVNRLQNKISDVFDAQFKTYMKSAGIAVDPNLFKVKLVEPQNFAEYKQAEIDEKRIGNFTNLREVKYLSKRFALRHYLGLTEDEIQENEALLKQETGVPDGGLSEAFDETRMLYDDKWIENRPDVKVDESWNNFTQESKSDDEEAPETETEGPQEGEAGGGEPGAEEPEKSAEAEIEAEPEAAGEKAPTSEPPEDKKEEPKA